MWGGTNSLVVVLLLLPLFTSAIASEKLKHV